MDTGAFLSTCAQVIPAIVIALLVEDRLYSAAGHVTPRHPQARTGTRSRQLVVLNIGMIVAVVGEFAALMGLLLGGPLWALITTLAALAILAVMLVLPLMASLRQELVPAPASGRFMPMVFGVIGVVASCAAGIAGVVIAVIAARSD